MAHRPQSKQRRAPTPAALLAVLASLAACTGPSDPGAAGSAPLSVSAVAPASGPSAGGTRLTIDGAGFTAGASVRLGGVAALQVVVESATRLTALAPIHAGGPVALEVRDATGQVAAWASAYTYVDPPAPSSVDPGHVPEAGGTVVLHGQGFGAGAQVRFGAVATAGEVQRLSAEQLVAVAPPQAPGVVDVTVVNPDGQQGVLFAGLAYQAAPPPPPTGNPPRLASVTPAAGSEGGGTVLALEGGDFDPAAEVTIGGAPATVTGHAATSLTVTTPPHAPGVVDVLVRNPDGRSSGLAAAFTYVAVPPPPPVLSALSPTGGPAEGGSAVRLSGSGFLAGATVTFGAAPAVVLAVTPDAVTVVTGSHPAAVVDVELVNPDGQRTSLPGAFTYVPALALQSVGPASGPAAGGTRITLAGTAFAAGAAVTVGGLAATGVSVTATTITATTPAHAAGVVPVSVRNPDGASASLPAAFAYLAPPAPVPTAAAPSSGPDLGGTPVIIAGSGFEAGATVAFDGTPGAVGEVSATAIAVTAPPHAAGAVDLVVTNPDGQQGTLPAGFAYLPPPRLSGVAPSGGPAAGGTPVTLAGSGFLAGAAVTFGGVPAVVIGGGSSSLEVTSPAHAAGPVDVVVANPDGRVAALPGAFTYLTPPPPTLVALSGLAPASGPDAGGTAVTLSGSNFEAGATVTFGGAAASVVAVSATAIAAVTPGHPAGLVDVTVTNPGGQSSTLAGAFTFVAPPPPPILASVLPATGSTAGGTAVSLSGAGFQPGAAVSFGGLPAEVVSSAATAIAVTTPAHPAGPVDVTVTNPDGQGVTLPGAFGYVAPPPPPPVLSGLAPASGTTAGGTSVTLSGAAFSASPGVTFGGQAATVTASSATSITATTPPHAAGPVDVVVTNPDGQKATLAAAYGYVSPPPPPALGGVSPASGTTAGGTQVVLAGGGFAAGVAVAFGAGAATVQGVTATSITVASPAHAAGAVDVTVTNPDGQASTLAGAFVFVAPPAPPTLASATPGSGSTAGGTSAVLAGAGFLPGATVTMGGVAATVGGLTPTAISITTPPHAAGAVDVVVANPDGQRAALPGGFTFVAPPAAPVLASVAPSSGDVAGGTPVVLGGTGFAGGAGVSFGGVAGVVTGATATSLSVTTPAGVAGAVDVVVTNPDGQSSALAGAFTYTTAPVGTPPVVSGLAPASGFDVGGTTVTIAGSEFVNPVVSFGGVAVVPSASTRTSISVATPAHAAGAVDVVVTNQDGQAATWAGGFTYLATPVVPPPVITSVSPASGPTAGNAVVTITGTGFAAGSAVLFGGVAGLNVAVLSGTSLSVTTPGGPAGPVDVTVVNFDRQAATLAGGYTYVAPPPVVTAINVRGAPQAGGGLLVFAGSGLADTVSVTFGGAPATDLTYDPARGTLTVTVPPSPLGPVADGFVDLVLTNLDGQSTTRPGFHYGNPPQAFAFTPTTGSKGDAMVITGVDFTADAAGPRAGLQVSFGGTFATIGQKSPTEITLTVPKLNPGTYTVLVVNFDSQFSVAPGTFFVPGP